MPSLGSGNVIVNVDELYILFFFSYCFNHEAQIVRIVYFIFLYCFFSQVIQAPGILVFMTFIL